MAKGEQRLDRHIEIFARVMILRRAGLPLGRSAKNIGTWPTSRGQVTGSRPVGLNFPVSTSAMAWPASTPKNQVATKACAFAAIVPIIKGRPEEISATTGLPSVENGLGQRVLGARQTGICAARRLAAHAGGFAKAQNHEVRVPAQVAGHGDARDVVTRDGHAWRKDNFGLGQRRREAFVNRYWRRPRRPPAPTVPACRHGHRRADR